MTLRHTSLAALVTLVVLAAPHTQNAAAMPGPWARTESRAACASFDRFRQPFFGDTHVHTAYSSHELVDATTLWRASRTRLATRR